MAVTTKDKRYVAYVSTYTTGDKKGIKIFDVDMKKGRFTEKDAVEITNSSYVTISHNHKFLYSITDFGVESYVIREDGSLKTLNKASINGMRGCYLSTDYEDKFLFVAGWHDGKITVLKLKKNGEIGEITEEIFHKGLGSIAERNFRPHVSCVKMTRDNKFLCAADLGMDIIDVYLLDHRTGKLKLMDVVHSEQESAPRHIKFSTDGHYMYVVHELKNFIDVYSITYPKENVPEFEKIQTISTLNDYHATGSAASALTFSLDHHYLVSSNAGDNSVIIFRIDEKDGTLNKILCLPVSGEYPKDAALFPDNKHLVALNNDSGTLTFFNVDLKTGLLVMNGPEMKVDQPNCIIFHELDAE
ncbi:MAG: lactonase family protein [Lachnospiraceae bacterium]|nr:lactonase family protein [Lachnospiraceae bacterium]